jgi:hypothetical protein
MSWFAYASSLYSKEVYSCHGACLQASVMTARVAYAVLLQELQSVWMLHGMEQVEYWHMPLIFSRIFYLVGME